MGRGAQTRLEACLEGSVLRAPGHPGAPRPSCACNGFGSAAVTLVPHRDSESRTHLLWEHLVFLLPCFPWF